ncbi:unnamed protein product [Nippostrongylus brasiliensis]|uniref:Uncharacterized protein n=1 Tax=Nippostrongylus brasiliensis TaxID=27835 RepID=A0A158R1L5_NIPBR|nr:unnamed protein product [Nippostrongylus brasiliensis]
MLVDVVLLTVKLLALIVSQYVVVFACIVTHNDENEIILRQIPGRSTPSWSRRPPTGTTRVGMTTTGGITPCCPRTVPPRMFDMPRQTEEPSTASEETPTTSDDYKSTTAPIGGVAPQKEMVGVAGPTEGTAAQQAAAGGVAGPTGAGAVQQAAGGAVAGPTGGGVGAGLNKEPEAQLLVLLEQEQHFNRGQEQLVLPEVLQLSKQQQVVLLVLLEEEEGPEAPNTAGCTVLTIVCPPGANNLMLVNLGIPVITVPVVGGIAATLTCATDGAWRTLNLPMFQIGMPITRVWCLVPMAPGR